MVYFIGVTIAATLLVFISFILYPSWLATSCIASLILRDRIVISKDVASFGFSTCHPKGQAAAEAVHNNVTT